MTRGIAMFVPCLPDARRHIDRDYPDENPNVSEFLRSCSPLCFIGLR
jgi:hypothetical protein